MSFIDEAWSGTLLITPPGTVPMWVQMREDCCGFILTKRARPLGNWSVTGAAGLNEEMLQIKERDQATHLPVCVHFFKAQATVKCFRSKDSRACMATAVVSG